MMSTAIALQGFYDYRLVAVSALISVCAAYAALDLAERVATVKGWARMAWLYSGALAMGIGIWAMHYVGMVAYHIPITVWYDWPTVVLSLVVAILASGGALYIVSRPAMSLLRLAFGGFLMGSGIAGMHYIGMTAMRIHGYSTYSIPTVLLSIVLAIVISTIAIQLAFNRRHTRTPLDKRKLASALVMGMAIPIMHYVGMAAATFYADPSHHPDLRHTFVITPFGLAAIVVTCFFILAHVCFFSSVDRRFLVQNQRLQERQAELEAIFESVPSGIAVLDRKRKIVRLNHAATKQLGIPERMFSFAKAAEFFSALEAALPDGQPLPLELRPSTLALRGEYVRNFEMHVRRYNSRDVLLCEVDTYPIPNHAGEITQVMMLCRDIGEQRQSEEARARLAAIVECSDDAIIGKDLRGIVTNWNKGAEMMFGYTAEEIVGQSYMRILPHGQEHEEAKTLARIARGEMVAHSETVRVRKGGELIHVSVAVSPICNTKGEIVGASKIVRDISSRKQLELQLRQSQKMEAIGQLTGGIAHDFNNLLGIIVGNLDLLERAVAQDASTVKRVQTAQRAALRGADLTHRLLAFSSRTNLHPAPVSVKETIQNVIELAGRTLGPEIRIIARSDDSIPSVLVDAAGLENALLNLALNARDAMPKGGSLTFSAQMIELSDSYPLVQTSEIEPGKFACISVSDSGHGMPREILERAFEPFFTTKPRHKGTGLGLAMVYGFMKQTGGAARIYSEPGFGTTVSLYLPLVDAVPLPAPPPSQEQLPQKLGGTALVVDDEPALLEIAQVYLSEMGYTVLMAEDSARALQMVAANGAIDLLLTDIIMPGGMNGTELAHKIRELRPGIRVLFTSGFPAEALAERSGNLVDGPMLRKPYARKELVEMIAKTMSEDSRRRTPCAENNFGHTPDPGTND